MNKPHNAPDMSLGPQQYGYPVMYQPEDEIDLFELFTSIFSQWKLITAITLAGTLLTIIITLLMPRQYEAVAQVAKPTTADIKALNTHGYEQYSPGQIFIKYYELLRSTEQLKSFLKQGSWYKELFPGSDDRRDKNELLKSFLENFEVEEIGASKEKKDDDTLEIKLIKIKLVGENELAMVGFVNDYIKYINDWLLNEIAKKGKNSIALERGKIERTIELLRTDAKLKRELVIVKMEEQNQEKLAELQLEKRLLLDKAKVDKESRIAYVEEAYGIAEKIGIKKITTLNSLAAENKNAKTMVAVGGKDERVYALMGTEYLNSELETLKNRKNDALFVSKIAQINKQIEAIKNDAKLSALKQRKSDDPYIAGLPDLFNRLQQLKAISFDFKEVKLYRLDQGAFVSGSAVKPNRKLIVAVGFVLSGFISLFVVLIVNGIKKRKEMKEIEVSV